MRICLSILLFTLTFCVGCASSPPESFDYLLRPQISSADYAAKPTIALDKIEVAPYLDRKGIVLETSPGQVDTAKHHRWADPLNFSIRRYLQVALTQETAQNIASTFEPNSDVETRVDVFVHQLHGSVTGTVKLVAEWQIRSTDSGEVTASGQFSAAETIAGDGYGEVVQAHAKLLDQLASSISAKL
jgi:uncharacterized lipoprotein YmbA